jgi:hypothetical protein
VGQVCAEAPLCRAHPKELRHLVAPVSPEPAVGQAQQQEIAAAVTEAECGTSTGFAKTSAALERRYRPEIERRVAREHDALKSFELKAFPEPSGYWPRPDTAAPSNLAHIPVQQKRTLS